MRRTVIVTGASRGIGRACAELFADRGYNVVVNYLNSHRSAKDLCEKLSSEGKSALAVMADVSSRKQVDSMIETVHEKYGAVDVLVNNAGISHFGLLCDLSEDDWDEIMDVNVKGMFNCSQAVIPDMVSRKYGKIVNISSMWGLSGSSCEVAYSTTKAAIIGLTKALAKELGPSNINVNCVAPGLIDTDMNSGLTQDDVNELVIATPMTRIGKTIDVAEAVYYLSSDEASFVTGHVLSVNGGYLI